MRMKILSMAAALLLVAACASEEKEVSTSSGSGASQQEFGIAKVQWRVERVRTGTWLCQNSLPSATEFISISTRRKSATTERRR